MKTLAALASIREEMCSIPGHTGFYYKNLVTGMMYGVRENEVFSAASMIKLPLHLLVLQHAMEGKLSLEDQLTVTLQDMVPPSGALTLFTREVTVDIRTLCRLMISLSDNTATNKLIELLSFPVIAEGFKAFGLEKTAIRRKLYNRAAARAGFQNTISLCEIGQLLEKIYRQTILSPEYCKEAVDTLLLQQVDHKINGKICGEVQIAHKTGEDDNLSNDVGIVYAPQPFIVCFAGHDTDVYRWEDLMRRGTYELLKAQE